MGIFRTIARRRRQNRQRAEIPQPRASGRQNARSQQAQPGAAVAEEADGGALDRERQEAADHHPLLIGFPIAVSCPLALPSVACLALRDRAKPRPCDTPQRRQGRLKRWPRKRPQVAPLVSLRWPIWRLRPMCYAIFLRKSAR